MFKISTLLMVVYKVKLFPSLLSFLRIPLLGRKFHGQTGFLNAHDSFYTTIVYIHYVFFPSFQFNSRKVVICCLMLKVVDFFLTLSLLGFFCLLVFLLFFEFLLFLRKNLL